MNLKMKYFKSFPRANKLVNSKMKILRSQNPRSQISNTKAKLLKVASLTKNRLQMEREEAESRYLRNDYCSDWRFDLIQKSSIVQKKAHGVMEVGLGQQGGPAGESAFCRA